MDEYFKGKCFCTSTSCKGRTSCEDHVNTIHQAELDKSDKKLLKRDLKDSRECVCN